MTAFELYQIHDGERFKVKGGRVIWEACSYRGWHSRQAHKCYISRLYEHPNRGKSWFLGLFLRWRYIDPNTIIEIVD